MKILNKYKQYGFFNFFKISFLAVLRPLLNVNEVLVFCISNHKQKEIDNSVKLMSFQEIDNWNKSEEISAKEFSRFVGFLNSGCIGYYIEIEGKLAAWGFVQKEGDYQYGEDIYKMPNNVHILKNLYVKAEYRGLSLGKEINQTRISNIPTGFIPCVYVIPENKYAIRNLKMYGFKEALCITKTKWFKKISKTKIKLYNNDKVTNVIVSGFTLD